MPSDPGNVGRGVHLFSSTGAIEPDKVLQEAEDKGAKKFKEVYGAKGKLSVSTKWTLKTGRYQDPKILKSNKDQLNAWLSKIDISSTARDTLTKEVASRGVRQGITGSYVKDVVQRAAAAAKTQQLENNKSKMKAVYCRQTLGGGSGTTSQESQSGEERKKRYGTCGAACITMMYNFIPEKKRNQQENLPAKDIREKHVLEAAELIDIDAKYGISTLNTVRMLHLVGIPFEIKSVRSTVRWKDVSQNIYEKRDKRAEKKKARNDKDEALALKRNPYSEMKNAKVAKIITARLERGYPVLLNVNSERLWGQSPAKESEDPGKTIPTPRAPDHFVVAFSAERDETGKVSGIWIADPGAGNADQERRLLSLEKLEAVHTSVDGTALFMATSPENGLNLKDYGLEDKTYDDFNVNLEISISSTDNGHSRAYFEDPSLQLGVAQPVLSSHSSEEEVGDLTDFAELGKESLVSLNPLLDKI